MTLGGDEADCERWPEAKGTESEQLRGQNANEAAVTATHTRSHVSSEHGERQLRSTYATPLREEAGKDSDGEVVDDDKSAGAAEDGHRHRAVTWEERLEESERLRSARRGHKALDAQEPSRRATQRSQRDSRESVQTYPSHQERNDDGGRRLAQAQARNTQHNSQQRSGYIEGRPVRGARPRPQEQAQTQASRPANREQRAQASEGKRGRQPRHPQSQHVRRAEEQADPQGQDTSQREWVDWMSDDSHVAPARRDAQGPHGSERDSTDRHDAHARKKDSERAAGGVRECQQDNYQHEREGYRQDRTPSQPQQRQRREPAQRVQARRGNQGRGRAESEGQGRRPDPQRRRRDDAQADDWPDNCGGSVSETGREAQDANDESGRRQGLVRLGELVRSSSLTRPLRDPDKQPQSRDSHVTHAGGGARKTPTGSAKPEKPAKAPAAGGFRLPEPVGLRERLPRPSETFTRRAFLVGGGAAVAAIAIAIGVGHHNRTTPIDANVAGQQLTLAPNTTYQDLIDSGTLEASVGDLVAVDNTTVLTVGGGNPYVVSCDGKQIDDLSRRVKQRGTVTIEEGTDVMEDHTDETSPAEMQYEFSGTGAISAVTQQGVAGSLITRTGNTSGMTVQFVDEESGAQPYIIESYNVEPTDKLVALTFDDGPSEYTPQYLDILSQHDAKATFFMLGQEVEAYPDYAKRASDEGHQLCTHSYSHANMYKLDANGVRDEIQKGIDAINKATGVTVREMRAPYGNWGQEQWKDVIDLVDRQIIWNIDTEDWRRPGVSAIVQACTNHAAPGKVILMHDGGGNREQDVEALPQIIETLQADGYRFVTIDELDGSGDHVSA